MKHIRKFNESEQQPYPISGEDFDKLENMARETEGLSMDLGQFIELIENEELVENEGLKALVSELIEFGGKLTEMSDKLFKYLEVEDNLKEDQ
jgi:hypothetical protein